MHIRITMEQTFIANSIVNFVSNRFTLDSNLSNVLNIAILKLLNCAKQINYSKLKLPKWSTMVLKQILANAKYGILLYLVKLLISYRLTKNAIEPTSVPTAITTELDNGLFIIDISNIDKLISTVHKFIDLHPEFFNTDINYQLVTLPNNPNPCKVYNDKLHFKDTIHNVEGFITTEFTKTIKNEKENTYTYDYGMHLYIKKNEPNKHCYMNQLEQYVNQETRFGSVVNLYYYKILPKNLVTSNFYHEPLDKWKDDCQYMEDTFFSEYKTFMFAIMKEKINYDISAGSGWNNLILYGSPGTGKSSFIYRIATIMKKSIISVDLSLYLDKKKELYALFHGQEFKLPEGNDNYNIANNTIIILEEFDNTIRKLVDLEQIYKLKQDLIELDFDKKKQSLINDDDGATDIIASDEPRPKKEKLSIAKVTHEIDQILYTNNINTKSDILRIADLLELFQGPVKDRLIIATTNYYDDIKNTLPALFRPGRLSPLAFNYLTWDLLNELTQYYFDTTMNVDQFNITIPTSQIIELALRYKDSFEEFQEELVLLHECTSDGPLTF